MRRGKQIHQGYSFFWGVFLLLVMSAAISIYAEAPSIKELVLFKDTLKNDTIVRSLRRKAVHWLLEIAFLFHLMSLYLL